MTPLFVLYHNNGVVDMINTNNLPPEPTALPQWVCWRYEVRHGKKTKVLKIPTVFKNGYPKNASSTDPQTWRSFADAVEAYQKHGNMYDGIGFVPKPEQGFVLIDIDNCISENGMSRNAQQILAKFSNTYAEKSVSGTGIHIICKGSISEFIAEGKSGSRTGSKTAIDGIKEIEVYCKERFFTFTGALASRTNAITENQTSIDWLFASYPSLNKKAKRKENAVKPAPSATPVSLSDAEIINKIRESRSSQLFSKLFDAGDTSGYINKKTGDDNDHSAADMALLVMLAFWCGGDKETMRRIFSASALGQREKWRDRTDYQDLSLDEAIKEWNGKRYDPAEYAKQMREKDLEDLKLQWDDHKEKEMQEIFFYETSDAGNAERVKALCGDDWLYCGNIKSWFAWDGQRWHESDGSELTGSMVKTFRLMKAMTAEMDFEDDKIRDKYIAFFIKSCNARNIQNAKNIFADLVNTDAAKFDSDSNLLNMPDGTYNLLTGELHPHRREDLITQMTGCTASTDYHGSLWEKTLIQIIPDADTRETFQRFAGYCLSGDISEEKFFVAYGQGGKGKGTLLETISAAMGDYATQIPVEVILKGKTGNGEAPAAQLLNLRGKRLALCSESGLGRSMDEAKIKWLTGGDTLTARGMYAKKPTSWKPTHKIIIQSNYLPHIADAMDTGIQRRLQILPFHADIDRADTTLKGRLCQPEELRHVMSWLLEGYRKWQSAGLCDESAEMLAAKGKFYADNDLLSQWFAEECIIGSEYEMPMKLGKEEYNQWLTGGRASTEKVGLKEFSADMEAHGYMKKRKNYGGYFFMGIGLKTTMPEENPFDN